MAEPAELSPDEPTFEMPMQQGAYSLVVKRRGDAVFVESLRCSGKGNPKDLLRLAKRLLNWQRTTGLTLAIIVETDNKAMLRYMSRWKAAKQSASVFSII